MKQKDAQEFSQFIIDGMKGDYKSSLKKHYGFESYSELEASWSAEVFKTE